MNYSYNYFDYFNHGYYFIALFDYYYYYCFSRTLLRVSEAKQGSAEKLVTITFLNIESYPAKLECRKNPSRETKYRGNNLQPPNIKSSFKLKPIVILLCILEYGERIKT
jgi:hypothetical protein